MGNAVAYQGERRRREERDPCARFAADSAPSPARPERQSDRPRVAGMHYLAWPFAGVNRLRDLCLGRRGLAADADRVLALATVRRKAICWRVVSRL